MYCPKCGAQNPEGAQLCKSCSLVLAGTSTNIVNPDVKTSRLAITSLVLMIMGFFTAQLTAIPALIFGIIALIKIKKNAGRLKGKGMAIAGIIVPTIVMALLIALMPALAKVKVKAYRIVCGCNLNALGKSMMLYNNDYQGKFPTPEKWCDLTGEYTCGEGKFFRCRGADEGPCNYAMNENIEKLEKNAPADMVLLFETEGGWNQVGGRELVITANHEGDGCNVLFCDGHVEFVRSQDIDDLVWQISDVNN